VSNVADNPRPARSLRRGVLFGMAAGALAGIVWFLVVIGTHSTQAYLIPLFGVVVAYGVFFGMRCPGTSAAISAVLITLAAMMFALFYVERHLLVKLFSDNGDELHIPLVPYLDWVVVVVRHALSKSPSVPFYALLGLVAAGWFGHQGFDVHDQRLRRP
jgi:hypothetical protein